MDIGDPSGDRVFDRDHGEFSRAVLHGREGVLEGRARQRVQVRKVLGAGDMRVRPRFALISNGMCGLHACFPGASMTRARSRSCGRVDAEGRRVDERDIDPHTRLQRPQLFELLAPLQRRRGQADKSPKRVAAIGVKTDMVQQAALAPGSAGAGEVERSQPGRTEFSRYHLDDIGIVFLLAPRDRRRERCDVDRALPQAAQDRRARSKVRWSADRPEH